MSDYLVRAREFFIYNRSQDDDGWIEAVNQDATSNSVDLSESPNWPNVQRTLDRWGRTLEEHIHSRSPGIAQAVTSGREPQLTDESQTFLDISQFVSSGRELADDGQGFSPTGLEPGLTQGIPPTRRPIPEALTELQVQVEMLFGVEIPRKVWQDMVMQMVALREEADNGHEF